MDRAAVKVVLGVRLKELRLTHKKTTKAVATFLNMTIRGYCCYEYGENSPPVDKLAELSELYGVSADYLLGLTNVKKRAGKRSRSASVRADEQQPVGESEDKKQCETVQADVRQCEFENVLCESESESAKLLEKIIIRYSQYSPI
jgi:transcriptional regulator with XRE-family HTH domain